MSNKKKYISVSIICVQLSIDDILFVSDGGVGNFDNLQEDIF